MDYLQDMINKQKELQIRLKNNVADMHFKERTAYIKEASLHLEHELHEMLGNLPYFKGWKDYSRLSLEENVSRYCEAEEEFIDVLHFVLNIALAFGFTDSEALHEAYCKKNKENHRRQDEGYIE